MPKIDITVAICTHNRTDGLRECLESLIKQDTGNLFTYEIVVIHTGSEGTPEAIEEISLKTEVPIRGIRNPHEGTVSARNRGFSEARGDWIAMFDDDQVAEPQWLRALWLVAQENNAKNVGGLLHLRLPDGCDRKLSQRCRRMLGETVKWETPRPYTRQEGPGTGNQMIHRSVLDQVGNFDQAFVLRGHDTDLYRRIRMAGFESWFSPHAVGYHIIPQYRLEDSFFKETSLHNGWSFARRDRLELGIFAAIGLAILRAGQALFINLPRLGISILRGDREDILDSRIRVWRAEGYVRSIFYMALPWLFTQNRFFKKYEFRGEKHFPAAT
jgi:GT2 family glycosyltransferase